jgi:AraC-like DNA-binding protein
VERSNYHVSSIRGDSQGGKPVRSVTGRAIVTQRAGRRRVVTFPPAISPGALRAPLPTERIAERMLPTLLALNLATEAQRRLTRALRGQASVEPVPTCRELLRRVQERGARAIVVELRDAEHTPTAPTVRRLRESWPLVPVLGYCASSNPDGADLLAVAQAGLTGLLVTGSTESRVAAIRDVIEGLQQAEDEVTARRAWATVAADVPEPARVVVEYCLRHGRRELGVDDLARALGMHRKTLWGRLDRAGLPSPEKVINWARLLHAAQRLETTDLSLARVATEYQHPSASALRNMLFRYTGLVPATVREPGGFELVLDAFRRDLRRRDLRGRDLREVGEREVGERG